MLDLQLNEQPKAPGVARDTDERRFEQDVLTASMSKPVLAAFWSQRSPACRQMLQVLEKLVGEAGGSVLMLRIDIEANPGLAQALRIQSVPTVYIFFQGKPVDGFAGVRPEAELKMLISGLKKLGSGLAPEEHDAAMAAEQAKKFMTEGDAFFQQGKLEDAMVRYSSALELQPENMEALGGLGWCLLTQGDAESVREMLTQLTPEQLVSPRLQGLQFIMSLAERAQGLPDVADLEKNLAAKPKDAQARYDLALRYLAAGQLEKGIDTLVTLIRTNRAWQDEQGRKFLLEVFDALGPAHPLTLPGRRKLSSVLFS